MREVAVEEVAAGMSLLMETGSPVRRWMRRYRGGAKKWLTPTRYRPSSGKIKQAAADRQYVRLEVSRVMLPYVIAYHDAGERLVKLWLDTREVNLFAEVG